MSTTVEKNTTTTTTIDVAKSWIEMDPNEKTSSYVQQLIQDVLNGDDGNDAKQAKAQSTLESLFPTDGSRIGFGTAGLRSAMEPGPLGMNDLVIIQATQGLAKYCFQVQQQKDSSSSPSSSKKKMIAVVGYDHRSKVEFNLSSKSFALLTKLVFLQAGFDECILFDGFVPTPLVAYATKKCHAAVGIMITASHNPKNDAGELIRSDHICLS